ncbi:MAG TPA: class I SAM-dependent methyltransferase [Candidatus Micrarchaeaceae archaeon]|nr:class I SAM-dependent methyltransferase [Candidatus Micrarchaeaceae archaeon]
MPSATASVAPEFAAASLGTAGAICPLCGSGSTRLALRDSGCSLHACGVCELFFIWPYPSSSRQHSRVSFGRYDEIELLDCERRYLGEKLYYDRHFPLIAEECGGAGSFLDVGCGTGHLLERLAAAGLSRRAGIELNAQAAAFARRVSGCEILEVPFERFRSEEKFDVVALINVFSHIPSFRGLFASLHSVLAPGGRVLIRTSEMAPHVSRWNQMHWGIPDDLHFLGLGTLDYVCRRFGFRIARHVRVPFEEELFRRSRWQQKGRSQAVNAVKFAGIHFPGALAASKALYKMFLGQRLYVSFIVLECVAAPEPAGPASLPRETHAKK